MYSYEEFKKELMEILTEKTGEAVRITEISKNNQIKKEVLEMPLLDGNIMPMLYLEDLYALYEDKGDIHDCADLIMEKRDIPFKGMELPDLCSWNEVRGKIVFFLVNRDWNQQLLEAVPYQEYLNLAVLFRVELDAKSSALVTDQLLKVWNVTTEDLWQAAWENLYKEQFEVLSLTDMVNNLAGNILLKEEESVPSQYVMFNERRIHGARGILRAELLQALADELGHDLILLPSSIHELILMPDSGQWTACDLLKMVCDINLTVVNKEEQLADCIYHFDRKTGDIKVFDECSG